jgi:hypothetical protein
MWAYKLISARGGLGPSGWYLVTNAKPLPTLDLNESSYSDLENFFISLATIPLVTNDQLRDSLTTHNPQPLYLASFPQLPASPPKDPPPSEPDGYTSLDIGSALPAYTRAQKEGTILVMGGGQDIFGSHDSFRFVSQKESKESADVRATILSFLDSSEHAKAGVMARWGDADRPDAAMVMVNLFPYGTLALVTRPHAGEKATETKMTAGVQLPVELRLQITRGHAIATYRENSGDWQPIGSATVPQDAGFHTGLVVCAHADTTLTTVKAKLGQAADDALPPPGKEGGDLADGPSLIARGSLQGTERSERYRDVTVEPGKRYKFSILAQREIAMDRNAQAGTVQLTLQSITDHGQITLNTRKFQIDQLPNVSIWRRLTVSGTADGPQLRILVSIVPSADGSRNGSVKLGNASLIVSE